MTGPDHYREAERLLRNTEATILNLTAASEIPDPDMVQAGLVAAQVHATLALAAATALGDRSDPDIGSMNMVVLNEAWGKVLR